jgi:RHS repeat-associated protein
MSAQVRWFLTIALAALGLLAGGPTFAADPIVAAIRAVPLAEPVVPAGATTPEEDRALLEALRKHQARAQQDDFSALTGFLARFPQSRWAPALQTNIGFSYLHYGYFSKAIDAWQQAWRNGRNASDIEVKALVDRAVGELALLYASLGKMDELTALFAEIGTRPITGSATERVQTAREMLNAVGKPDNHLFMCGPMALQALAIAHPGGIDVEQTNRLQWTKLTKQGTSLADLSTLGGQIRFAHRLIYRQPGQPLPMPAVMHFKVGHFAAILREQNGRLEVQDVASPTGTVWMTPAAVDAEASGYFLVPQDLAMKAGWRVAQANEAANVWGKGSTSGTRPGDAGDPTNKTACSKGMCAYAIKESAVSLMLTDQPVGYTPAYGPSAQLQLTYNQREDSQPAIFTFVNVGQKWTFNWLSFVTDDPANVGASVSRYISGGGSYTYSGYVSATGRFAAQDTDGSILVRVSGSPIKYQRQLADGGIEIYSLSNGATSYPRRILLTQIIDPQGNTLTLNYDGQMRLTSITDAVGRQTTFTYGSFSRPLQITQITDPFGRSATLTYNGFGNITSITDVLGITSILSYDNNQLVNSLTTPYGTATFAYTAPGTSGPPRFVQITDAMGFNEREEWIEPGPTPSTDPPATIPTGMPTSNSNLQYRNSYYWDKTAYVLAGCTPTGGCDYAKARIRHFTHTPNFGSLKSTSLDSVKYPLENRVWYAYPGQNPNTLFGGTTLSPTSVGRVLDNGTTQLSTYSYDTAGYFKLLQMVDPLGRTTTFTYSNQIDLAAVSQTTAFGNQTTIAQYEYNYQHRPLSYVDAAGKVTTFTYNAVGQLTSVTNPLGQTTQYQYDGSGNLSTVINANNQTAATYTYDSYARVRTFTDSEGWTVTYDYDAADRVTKKTYPDSTFETYAYTNLDLTTYTDREGRQWTYAYDANRRLIATTDPAGKQTQFGYNQRGQVTSLTDPRTNVTQWAYDVQGRLTSKQYPDTSTVTYGYETTTSRLKTITDALAQVKTYAYAKDDRLTGITYTNAVNTTPNVNFTWDPYFPRLTAMTDGIGTRQYTYVPVGSPGALELQQESGPLASSAITSAYDELGRLTSRTVQSAGAETFQYDALGRVTVHTNDLGTFNLAYLGQTDQIASRQLASSTLATTWSYLTNTGDRRLSGIANTGLTSGHFSNFTYTTTPENFISGISESSDAAAVYPAAGSQTATYNTLNQLTNLSGQVLTFDANGNLTSDGQRNYAWDAENRLVGITYPGVSGKATAFTYDGLSRRATISSTPPGGGSATVTSYLWCGDDICQARNASNATIRSYYDQGEYLPGTPAPTLYYGIDQIGSVRRVFTSTTSAAAYGYDPYGVPLQATAPATDFVYAGMFFNADSGLYLTNYRAFDPVAGRWLSRDPIGEVADRSGNLYAYVGGDTVNQTDPSGEFAQIVAGGVAGATVDITLQLVKNGGDFSCIDWSSVGQSAAIGGGVGLIGKIFIQAYAALAALRAAKLTPILPQALTLGTNAQTGIHVYFGLRGGQVAYCGITCNLAQRAAQHGARFDKLQRITTTSVTRGEARAIEQALIGRNPGFENIRNTISPAHPWHQKAVEWGEAWLKLHGY